jgi:hypothetical protein
MRCSRICWRSRRPTSLPRCAHMHAVSASGMCRAGLTGWKHGLQMLDAVLELATDTSGARAATLRVRADMAIPTLGPRAARARALVNSDALVLALDLMLATVAIADTEDGGVARHVLRALLPLTERDDALGPWRDAGGVPLALDLCGALPDAVRYVYGRVRENGSRADVPHSFAGPWCCVCWSAPWRAAAWTTGRARSTISRGTGARRSRSRRTCLRCFCATCSGTPSLPSFPTTAGSLTRSTQERGGGGGGQGGGRPAPAHRSPRAARGAHSVCHPSPSIAHTRPH